METEKLIAHFRGTDVDIENILRSQDIARDCLCHMEDFLRPGMDREEIHRECERYMLEKGSEGWWIHNDPALILFGDLTTYSAHEDPSPLFEGKRVQENDLITEFLYRNGIVYEAFRLSLQVVQFVIVRSEKSLCPYARRKDRFLERLSQQRDQGRHGDGNDPA